MYSIIKMSRYIIVTKLFNYFQTLIFFAWTIMNDLTNTDNKMQ